MHTHIHGYIHTHIYQHTQRKISLASITACNVSKCGVVSVSYFPVFGPEIAPYLGTFLAVNILLDSLWFGFGSGLGPQKAFKRNLKD